jgi:protein TonB
LLFSLVVHAGVGGLLLFQAWPRATVERAPTLTVQLDVIPPAVIEPPVPPAPPKIKLPTPAPKVQHVAPRPQPAPTPAVITVQRADVSPTSAAQTIPDTPPAPVAVFRASSVPTVTAPRSEPVEPPHFDVAYLNNPRPAYPPIARKLGLEGVVLLRVDVSAKGTPEKIVIAQTSGASMLDDAAMKAVQGWTFVPARRGDAAIAHPVEVPIRFQLKN